MKVLVIGSGPIVIGQAAEFDYAGTQACKSLKEEGHEVVLINSNPATIMTDPGVADALYIEPLTPEFCERVIAREKPDALLPTLGGQTGLNLATQLADLGILEKYSVKLLGTPLAAIRKAEDREEFRALMREIKEPVPESFIIETPEQLKAILDTRIPDENGRLIDFPYPRIVRPAYTLGGTGGGIANTPEELWEIGQKGLQLSMRSQIMIERSLLGWKEVEYEVMRDSKGNCITICNMENFDPMGVHTGDSIVIAPSQTLSDLEYHMLRTASLKIISSLGIEGGCNVQLAINPDSFDYYVIEVNPRVSRSSALASKATGYPIARVAAKIAVGKTLDEIENQVTKTTKACFEPALDYCVVKIPRWPFDKFASGDRSLFTQMKATGEVMAIDRTFEAAFLKAIRGLEVKQKDLRHPKFMGSAGSGMGVSPMRPTGVPPVDSGAEGEHGRDAHTTHGRDARATAHGRDARATVASSPAENREPAATIPFTVEYEGVFDPTEVDKRKGAYLPHWAKDGAYYHITFRLADSVPKSVSDRWRLEREELEKRRVAIGDAEYFKLKSLLRKEIDEFLDSGKGSCILAEHRYGELVANAIKHFDGERYTLAAWCVMPNHVHAVVRPHEGHELSSIIHSWKSFTAHEIKKTWSEKEEIWQAEYYDHLIRDAADMNHAVEYVLANPEKGSLKDWPWVGRGKAFVNIEAPERSGSTSGMGVSPMRPTGVPPVDSGAEGEHGRDAHATHGRDARATPYASSSVLIPPMADDELRKAIQFPTDERLWAIAEGLRRGWGVDEVNRLSNVDKWFLTKMQGLLDVEQRLVKARETNGQSEPIESLVREAFLIGFPSPTIASLLGVSEEAGKNGFHANAAEVIARLKTQPVFKMVDTCAAEFESATPYYYGTFEQEDDATRNLTEHEDKRETVLVLGSGPIRIGQGIEFDYSCVHCVWALEELGYRAVIVNNNPETVSTDFDTGDGLYFEPVTLEDTMDIVRHEQPIGAVVQFGGQTAINLAQGLHDQKVPILGTSAESIAMAEDRDLFEKLLTGLDIAKPAGRAVRSFAEAIQVASEVGYPVLVRPSFVLGGRAMEIVFDEEQLEHFYREAEDANPGQPVLVDKYLLGIEAEVDVISDGEDTLVPGIMEHIERAGVHSGDSMAVYPAVHLSEELQAEMVVSACKIARALKVKGLMNIQFVIAPEGPPPPTPSSSGLRPQEEGLRAYVLEVNPRGSRTVPYISKVTGIPMVDLATRCMMGQKLKDMGYGSGLWTLDAAGSVDAMSPKPHATGRIIPEEDFINRYAENPSPLRGEAVSEANRVGVKTSDIPNLIPEPSLYAIKAPVFSFQKLGKVEPSLGPEMKSTGEILGVDKTYEAALYKALIASHINFKSKGYVLLTVQDPDKPAAIEIAKKLVAKGFKIAATGGTHDALSEAGIESRWVMKISEGEPNLLDLILKADVSLMINTPSNDRQAEEEAARIRRACIETGVACVTNIDTANALVRALDVFEDPMKSSCTRLEEYFPV